MLTIITSLVGGFVFLAGLVWAVVQFASRNAEPVKQVIHFADSVIPGDQSQLTQFFSGPKQSRTDAIKKAEELMVYCEQTKNEKGQEAVRDLVLALFGGGDARK